MFTGSEPLTPWQRASKRLLDIVLAATVLALTWWLILLCALAARLDTGASGFFLQERVGRNGRLFRLIKVRSMRLVPGVVSTVTTRSDVRVTPLGRLLRRFKLDELPQFINVLVGDMSVVGPRPDVPAAMAALPADATAILTVRPGITGPATLKYRDEESILERQPDPEWYNSNVIFPDKVAINLRYVRDYRFALDLYYILATAFPFLLRRGAAG